MNVFEDVMGVLENSLGVERVDIYPDSHLLDDLGADSLDMLDVTFQLEQKLGVRLEREQLFPDWLFYQESECLVGGRLNQLGTARFGLDFPFMPPVAAGTEAKSLLTVRLLTGLVGKALVASRAA